jgi:hypothetical protein
MPDHPMRGSDLDWCAVRPDGEHDWVAEVPGLGKGVAYRQCVSCHEVDVSEMAARLAEVEGDHAKLGRDYESFMAERDAARALIGAYDRYRAKVEGERDEANRNLERARHNAKSWRLLHQGALGDRENERANVEALKDELADITADFGAVEAQRDAMQSVVEAAKELLSAFAGGTPWPVFRDAKRALESALQDGPSAPLESPKPLSPEQGPVVEAADPTRSTTWAGSYIEYPNGERSVIGEWDMVSRTYIWRPDKTMLQQLAARLDSLQDGPSAPLSSPPSPSQPELVPDSTDGVGEQGEAQGACNCAWNNGHAPAHMVGHHGNCPAWVPRPGALGSDPHPERRKHYADYSAAALLADREQIPGSSIHSEGGSGRVDVCGAGYTRPGGRQRGDRIVRCDRPNHVAWEAHLESETGVEWHEPDVAALYAESEATPADPPWLEEAIEAAARAIFRYDWDNHLTGNGEVGPHHRPEALAAIRAALPHITGGVLADAANKVDAMKPSTNRFWDAQDAARVYLCSDIAKMLRAARQVTS